MLTAHRYIRTVGGGCSGTDVSMRKKAYYPCLDKRHFFSISLLCCQNTYIFNRGKCADSLAWHQQKGFYMNKSEKIKKKKRQINHPVQTAVPFRIHHFTKQKQKSYLQKSNKLTNKDRVFYYLYTYPQLAFNRA